MSSRSLSFGLGVHNRHSNIVYVVRYEERFIPYNSGKALKSENYLLQKCRFKVTLDKHHFHVCFFCVWELFMACSCSSLHRDHGSVLRHRDCCLRCGQWEEFNHGCWEILHFKKQIENPPEALRIEPILSSLYRC